MAIKVVIDTNVWVSAIINPHGHPARLRALIGSGKFQVVVSPPLLEEIVDVLQRPRIRDKYGISPEDIEELVVLIDEICENIPVTGEITVCRDGDDNLVIETAIKGGAKYLITRDDDIKNDEAVIAFLEKNGIRITTIATFLQLLST